MAEFDHIKIAIREKPLADEERSRVQVVLRTDKDKLIAFYPESKEGLLYDYDYFFPEDATQMDVYQTIGMELVHRVMAGYSATCVGYGPSGSGKTHTLFGSDRESGLIQLVYRELFTQMNNDAAATRYEVKFCYWEMNNEEIRDALNPGNTLNLLVRKNKQQEKLYGGGGIYIPGLTVVTVQSWEELDAFIMKGNVHRIHMSEQRGARWHGFLKLFVLSSAKDEGTVSTARTLNFVQLKGADRVGQKGARGEVFRHGSSINKSISILGSAVLHATELRKQAMRRHYQSGGDPEELQERLPALSSSAFQESKMTQVLTSALSGAECTIFIGTLSGLDYHEATDTLENLQNIQQVTCAVRQHTYKTTVGKLQDKLKELESQVVHTALAEGHPLSELEERIQRLKDKYAAAAEGREAPPAPTEQLPKHTIEAIEVEGQAQLWKQNTVRAKLHGDRATVYIPMGSKATRRHTYKGQWAHGRREGYGEYVAKCTKYAGEWANGMKDGEGTLWIRAKEGAEWRRVYRGAWQKDMRHGSGVNWYENGDVYEGYYDHDKRSAIGKLYFANGDRMEGQWKDDKVEGWATLYQKNGDWFEGHWIAGLREGPGMWVYESKQQCLRGEWYKGVCRCGVMEDLPRKGTNEHSAFLPRCELRDPDAVLRGQQKKWDEVRREERGSGNVDWESEAAKAQQEPFEAGRADDDEEVKEDDLRAPSAEPPAGGEEVSW